MKTKQDEILEADYMDQNSKTKYASDINNVHQQILSSLQAICPTKDQKVTERQLIDMLKQKMPSGKKLNTSLFLQVFQDLNRDLDNKIDLNEFVVKYIHSHEELRMFLELGKQEMENQQNLKSELENQAFEAKNEQLNKYNISLRSEISIQIQKVQLYNQGDSSDIFFRISYEGDSKKTSSRSVNDLNFIEKISFFINNNY